LKWDTGDFVFYKEDKDKFGVQFNSAW